METMLKVGLRGEASRRVELADTAKAMGSGELEVYATPAMIAFMENTAYQSVAGCLEPGQGTVGIYMEAKHLAASPIGAEISCVCELAEIDRKRLRFNIEVRDGAGVIGTAVHDRFIVDNGAFMDKCAHRLD